MSEPPAKPDKPDTPAEPPASDVFEIKLTDDLKDKELNEKMNVILKQNAELLKANTELNTERQLAKRDKQIEEKLVELESIKEGLREKYKDQKDLGRLDDAIIMAKEYEAEAFPPLKGADDADIPAPSKNMMDPYVTEEKRKII